MKTFELISLGIITLIFCNSCKGNKNNELEYAEPVFEEEINTNIKVLNNSFLFNFGYIGVVDTIIIYSGRTDVSDKSFHLFSKNNGKYLISFGNIGRAKGEKSQPGGGFSIDKEKKIVYVFDNALGKAISYSLDKVMSGDMDYAKDIYLPDIVNNVASHQFLYLKKSFLVGYSRSARFLISTERDSITCSNFYPSLSEPEPYKKVERQYYWSLGCMAAKPDGDMFVHATRNGCILEIWKNNGNSISPYIIKGFFKPNYQSEARDMNFPRVLPNMDDPYGISVLSCTNQFIYAKYNNLPSKSSNKIAVFDWKGNPKKIYIANRDINTFYVDNDKVAYGLANNDNDNIELITIQLK